MTEIKMTGLGWMETTGKASNKGPMATPRGRTTSIIFLEEKMISIGPKLLSSSESIFDYNLIINLFYS